MTPTIETIEARPILGIRRRVRTEEIGNTIGELLGRVMPVAAPHMAGPILSRWHTWEADGAEMEVAVPVRAPLDSQGDIQASILPAGPAAVVLHVGPYDTLKDSWAALTAWMAETGTVGRAAPWEEYLDDQGVVPQDEIRSRIVWPIKE